MTYTDFVAAAEAAGQTLVATKGIVCQVSWAERAAMVAAQNDANVAAVDSE